MAVVSPLLARSCPHRHLETLQVDARQHADKRRRPLHHAGHQLSARLLHAPALPSAATALYLPLLPGRRSVRLLLAVLLLLLLLLLLLAAAAGPPLAALQAARLPGLASTAQTRVLHAKAAMTVPT